MQATKSNRSNSTDRYLSALIAIGTKVPGMTAFGPYLYACDIEVLRTKSRKALRSNRNYYSQGQNAGRVRNPENGAKFAAGIGFRFSAAALREKLPGYVSLSGPRCTLP
jgi:hypothetical protein